MAKIAIMCSPHMVDMYKQQLTDANIAFEIDKESSDEKLVVFSCVSEQDIIEPIINKVTAHFKGIAKRLK